MTKEEMTERLDWLGDKSNEKRTNFKNADLNDVCLNNADLSGADFRQADSSYINLRHTDLSDADWQLVTWREGIQEFAKGKRLIVTFNNQKWTFQELVEVQSYFALAITSGKWYVKTK